MNKKLNVKKHLIHKIELKIFMKKKRGETDFNYKLAHNIRSRTYQAIKSQNVKKTGKTIDLIECSNYFLKKWIKHQLYGDMISENYGSSWELDHYYPLS